MYNLIQARRFATYHSKIAVVGAGAAGHSFIGNILRFSGGAVQPTDITVFDPSEKHIYQPSQTMIGGGVIGNAQQASSKEGTYLVRSQAELLARNGGVQWVQQAVSTFQPSDNAITLANGDVYKYDFLVVNPGLELRFDLIKGAQEALDDPDSPVSTIYTVPGAYKTSVLRENFKGGRALFTMPTPPIKCGGAPLKIMFLSEESYRRTKVRDHTEVVYYTGTQVFFPPQKKFSDAIVPMAERKGIKANFGNVLQSIDKANRVATLKNKDGDLIDVNFDLLHFVPPQTAPEFIRKSELAHTSGWVDVNRNTL